MHVSYNTCCVLCGVNTGLQVSLSEPNADHSSPLHLKDSPRTIPLVPGKTYSLLCDGTWHGPGELGVTQDGGNLTLQLDSEDMGGEYVCVDENGAEFVVIITSGLKDSRELKYTHKHTHSQSHAHSYWRTHTYTHTHTHTHTR